LNAEENEFAAVVIEEVPRPAAVATASRNGSFPLIALLQLASFTAVLVACIDGRELRQEIASANYIVVGTAALVSSFLGFIAVILGFGWSRLGRTALVAAVIGSLHGPAFLAAYAAPAPFIRAFPAIAVLVLSTILLRVRSS
jgi:hypothetical protein